MNITMHDAKTHLSQYVERALAGEEIVLARASKPLVVLMPLSALEGKRNNVVMGTMKGAFEVPDNFDDPLPDEVVNSFYVGGL